MYANDFNGNDMRTHMCACVRACVIRIYTCFVLMKIDDMQRRLTRMSTFSVYTINFIIDNYQKRQRKIEKLW